MVVQERPCDFDQIGLMLLNKCILVRRGSPTESHELKKFRASTKTPVNRPGLVRLPGAPLWCQALSLFVFAGSSTRHAGNRGGIVVGKSAGATIEGSYLVRGFSNPDDNAITMAPGHGAGFGLIT